MNYKADSKTIEGDLFIGVGRNCKCAYYLRKHNLRLIYSPLDWMYNYSIGCVAKLFGTKFANFFVNTEEDFTWQKEHRKIKDTNTGMISLHYFKRYEPLEEQIKKIAENSVKHFEKIENYINYANHIVFVSCRNDTTENFGNFLLKMQKRYGRKFTYLNIRNAEEEKEERIKINESLEIIDISFKDENPDIEGHWLGNCEKWDKVMKRLKLSGIFSQKETAISA